MDTDKKLYSIDEFLLILESYQQNVVLIKENIPIFMIGKYSIVTIFGFHVMQYSKFIEFIKEYNENLTIKFKFLKDGDRVYYGFGEINEYTKTFEVKYRQNEFETMIQNFLKGYTNFMSSYNPLQHTAINPRLLDYIKLQHKSYEKLQKLKIGNCF